MFTVHSKKFVVNEVSFQPMLHATVSFEFSLETLQDALVGNGNTELCAKIGAALLEQVQAAYSTGRQFEEVRHIHEEGMSEEALLAEGFKPVTELRQLWYRLK